MKTKIAALLLLISWMAVWRAISPLRDLSVRAAAPRGRAGKAAAGEVNHDLQSLRLAIEDLMATFGRRYARGREYLSRLESLERAARRGDPSVKQSLQRLQQEALLANPLLDLRGLLVVKRKPKDVASLKSAVDEQIGFSGGAGREIGMPSNHECNSSLERLGYDNEIAILSPLRPDGKLTTLFRPPDGGYVGEIDLHWDADRLLMTRSDRENWKIWEIGTDGAGLRRVSRMPRDVDCMDPCYLPSGKIVFGSTASYQSVPCWHGRKWVTNLYEMNEDGTGVRQLCFDQDHDFHPCVLDDGRVVYNRWDYTGIVHIYLRELMVMNPDGTGQRAVYGSNSWYPNSLYFPRPIPGRPNQLVCILSGYHGVHRMGELVIVDTSRGWSDANGLVRRISGSGAPIKPVLKDALVDGDWPKFLHPYPLSDKYFVVSCWKSRTSSWGIYLADVFDNLVLIREEPGYALLEPVPLRRRPKPPVIPDKVDLRRDDATVYLNDIYAGRGLAGVPRGVVKRLRLVAYHFGYRGLAGPDKIGYGGPWEAMRILGTVPVEEDGSAVFRVPANTPVAVQALDAEGQAVQLMRSWFTAMPGEYLSCVGCHEPPEEVSAVKPAAAAYGRPREITPWRGPPRGFDFAREVQPVLDRYCVSCHNGPGGAPPDLRPADQVKTVRTWPIAYVNRLDPKMREETGGRLRYTPAYDALIRYIRRVGIEDDASLLVPGEYEADTSPLIQLLRKGHGGVRLDDEAWDRLITWIDLNAPCHGTWGEVYPIPGGAKQRRMALRRRYGGPKEDPEFIPPTPRAPVRPVRPSPPRRCETPSLPGWPIDSGEARRRQAALAPLERLVDLGGGETMRMVRIPAGRFIMGDASGEPDECPPAVVTIGRPFWMSVCEVTNAQFRRFDPGHDSGRYVKRRARADGPGLSLNEPEQPVVRVSWEEAEAFCRWLSARTGEDFRLPTEAQWEYACRAGGAGPLSFGALDADFSAWANVADRSFSHGLMHVTGRNFPPGVTQATGGVPHFVLEGASLSDARFDDGRPVTAPVGGREPNVWGLYDMHGNAAEWTRSEYRPYPYREEDGRNERSPGGRKAVRGGSFFDPPARCRSAYRLSYPSWRRVFNVGFRVICR